MSESPSRWPLSRIIAWGATAAVFLVVVGPTYVRAFLPPPSAYTDFLQEWLSARNYLSGAPIYREMSVSIEEHLPRRPGTEGARRSLAFTDPASGSVIAEMKYNAHPPFAVLVAVPFAILDYPHAHLAWNLATYALFLAAIAAVIRELRLPFAWPAIFPAIILLLGNPVLNQVYQGQLNCLLAALITAAWVADRRDRPGAAGLAIGVAGALKLYPLFLLVYFLAARRWTGFVTGMFAFLAANFLAGGLFGSDDYRDYATTVVPAVAGQFEASWVNLSLHGFWLRLMLSVPLSGWIGPTSAMQLGRIGGIATSLVVSLLVAASCWRAATRDDRDRAWAIAIVAMLLVSPITWSHYSLLLLVPLAVAWMRATTGASIELFGAIVAILWLPPEFATQLWLGRDSTNSESLSPVATGLNLTVVSLPHYALLALLVLMLRFGGTRSETDVVEHDRG